MKKKHISVCYMLALICFSAAFSACGSSGGQTITEESITMYYQSSGEAFANPMMGFRPTRYIQDTTFPAGEYVTICKQYIKYTDLEDDPSDTVKKIKDWSDKTWKGVEERNLKIIPRVVIVYPNGPDGGSEGYWPKGIEGGDNIGVWVSDELLDRLKNYIKKLGEAWNDDPRVAAIEMGVWGSWGEHHIYPLSFPDGTDRIPLKAQLVLGEAFKTAFPDKKVMVRYPAEFEDFDYGYYWDSFALPDDDASGNGIIMKDTWRGAMNSGEVAYDWGDQTDLGGSPDGTLKDALHTAHVMKWVRLTHTSSLGWIADYNQSDETIRKNAAKLQKLMGYRYTVKDATFTSAVNKGGALDISLDISNDGAAPFYYQWPLQVSLLDEKKQPVWSDIAHVDIRNWRPNHSYNVTDSFTLPKNLKAGTYTLALAVLDPAGMQPSLRFANVNYYNGGYTPLGKVGVGQTPSDNDLGSFDSLYADRSLAYKVDRNPFTIADNQNYPEENDPEPVIPTGPSKAVYKEGNLAYQKPVEASSVESAYNNSPEKVNDGDPTTRWSSEWDLDPSWIYVDLEGEYTISRVTLNWEWSYAKAYEIQVSQDAQNWNAVYHTDDASGETEEITFAPTAARYVRLFCIERALTWGYSIYEIEVYE